MELGGCLVRRRGVWGEIVNEANVQPVRPVDCEPLASKQVVSLSLSLRESALDRQKFFGLF